ncbi:DUF4861 family protein [Gaetbulibacter aquiaggeris]|uniref:DUF4861 family protein n=1 Tax=Gaetbulibacter aquiaggeris TaxID=1735373 RepID=A0ABW7MLJ7_9FLAO
MLSKKIFQLAALAILVFNCSQKDNLKTITIKNTLDIERTFETVELSKGFLKVEDLSNIGIKDVESGLLQVTQAVDNDADGVEDVLLFQPQMKPLSENTYQIIYISEGEKPKAQNLCYSRFVPERTDDYAWENDKVAFRIFGPDAQRRFENNLEEGTLSSGVDAWLKKVKYPIINNWYKKYTEKTGSYHVDTGEGLDNFHVGKSRGVGGVAYKKDSIYYVSKNFTKWRTITTGPLRTSFYVEYKNWDAGGKQIIESKVISLDLGNNFSKFEVTIEGADNISPGLTMHEKDGIVSSDETNWVSYWQPHFDSELGMALLTKKEFFNGYEEYNVAAEDLSNAYLHLKIINGKTMYYAGFGWKKSDQFSNKEEWEHYLNDFTERLNNPLEVVIVN